MNNNLHRSVKFATLFAIVAATLTSFSMVSYGCPGKSLANSNSVGQTQSPTGSPTQDSMRSTVKQTPDELGSVARFDTDVSDHQARMVGAIVLATLATGSLSLLAYKAWAMRKFVPIATASYPVSIHPELYLTDLPREALPDRVRLENETVEADRDIALTR